MKTAAELEAELSQAAERLRAVLKASKDQAAKATPEPVEPARGVPGAVLPGRPPTVPTR